MDNILKLIKEEDVKWVKLGEVIDYEQPNKYIVSSTEYKNEYKTPVLTAGQTFILGYTNEENGIFKASKENPVIIFDDFTTSNHWVDFNFKVKSSAMKFLRPKTDEVLFRYCYYYMQLIKIDTTEHKRMWISKYSNVEIAIPSLETQRKIVDILDRYTKSYEELKECLAKEKELRIKQYEYYRDKLLSEEYLIKKTKELCGEDAKVEEKRLGEVLGYEQPNKYIVSSTEYKESYKTPVLTAGQTFILGYTNEENGIFQASKENPVIIFDDFTTSNHWVDFDFKVKSSAMKLLRPISKEILFRYAYYCMKILKIDTTEHKRMWISKYSNLMINLPPLEVQTHIVEILDKFDKLTNNIKEGLPKEIELRTKQYEYYREKILSF